MALALSLSIVMPALNEENNIAEAVTVSFKACDTKGITDREIIVINDGSTDKTLQIVQDLQKKHADLRVISHDTPQGIGKSFWHGAHEATKNIVVMFPGDNEHDALDALSFLDLLDRVDIVVPFIHNQEVRAKSRRVLSFLFRQIINLSFGINLNYTNGTVFYRRSLFKDIDTLSTGFFYQAELLIRLIRRGYLFAEVPNVLSVRRSGKSKALSLRSLRAVMGSYLGLLYKLYLKRDEKASKPEPLQPDSISAQKKQT